MTLDNRGTGGVASVAVIPKKPSAYESPRRAPSFDA